VRAACGWREARLSRGLARAGLEPWRSLALEAPTRIFLKRAGPGAARPWRVWAELRLASLPACFAPHPATGGTGWRRPGTRWQASSGGVGQRHTTIECALSHCFTKRPGVAQDAALRTKGR